jgi:hypothetical protein
VIVGVAAAALIAAVRVVLCAIPGVKLSVAGFAVTPAGSPSTATETAPLNPLTPTAKTLTWLVAPAVTVSDAGETANVKSGGEELLVAGPDMEPQDVRTRQTRKLETTTGIFVKGPITTPSVSSDCFWIRPNPAALLLPAFQLRKHFLSMALGPDLREDLQQTLVRADQECGPLNAHDFFPIHIFLFQNVKLLAHLFVHIGQQGIGKVIFFLELALGFGRVAGYAEHDSSRLLQLREGIAKAAGLNGAARRVGFRIKEQDHGLARKVAQVYGLLLVVLKGKIGNFLMQFHRLLPLKCSRARHSAIFPRLIDCCLPTNRMSRNPIARTLLLGATLLAAGSFLPASAQYVGHIDTNKENNAPTLRATAVLEYTGDLTKPTASRLVPIAVWDGERYQPGGLYLAQPVPLTVQFGTQYVLQVAGTPKGLFNVKAASDVQGSWVAIGTFQKEASPTYAKLRRSRTLPRIRIEDDKPHFAHVPAGDTNPGSTPGSTAAKNTSPDAPPVDPDRPTLHRRADDGSTPTASSDSSGTSNTSPSTSDTDPERPTLHRQTDSGSAQPASGSTDPDRPTLHHQTNSASGGENETATTTADPNRPHLGYGRPKDLEPLDAPSTVEIAKLASTPVIDIEQIAAVSDAATRQLHSYVYSWSSPDDEKKAQSALEAAAQLLLAKSAPPVTAPATNRQNVTRRVTNSHTVHAKTTKPTLPALTDEQFKAFELSYGGGATLVFSATTGQGNTARYITLIAQPDFNGNPIVLFKQITAQHDLDIIPRMKLVDAVDTDADNRAELIFALENTTGRQYAIYRVANNRVEQVFTTGS